MMVLVLLLGAAACGDDDDSADPSPAQSDGASAENDDDNDNDADNDSDADTTNPLAPPDGEGLSVSLDILGQALEQAMGEEVTGYEVDGSTLRVNLDEPWAEFSMDCMIIEMTAGSLELPEGSEVQLVYNDGGVNDCDIS